MEKVDDLSTLLAKNIDTAVKNAGGGAIVSRRSGIPLRTLGKWMSGDATPLATALRKLADATGRSPNWLMDYDPARSDLFFPSQMELAHNLIVEVPVLDIFASAGSGSINEEPSIVGHQAFPETFLQRLGVRPKYARLLYAFGDSMYPTILDRAAVMIDISFKRLMNEMIYVIVTPDGLRLKRVLCAMDGSVTLISDNKELYPPERISASEVEEINVVGRAFWTEKQI